jgi:hypothetical protein
MSRSGQLSNGSNDPADFSPLKIESKFSPAAIKKKLSLKKIIISPKKDN